jgi:hypothetical protein
LYQEADGRSEHRFELNSEFGSAIQRESLIDVSGNLRRQVSIELASVSDAAVPASISDDYFGEFPNGEFGLISSYEVRFSNIALNSAIPGSSFELGETDQQLTHFSLDEFGVYSSLTREEGKEEPAADNGERDRKAREVSRSSMKLVAWTGLIFMGIAVLVVARHNSKRREKLM